MRPVALIDNSINHSVNKIEVGLSKLWVCFSALSLLNTLDKRRDLTLCISFNTCSRWAFIEMIGVNELSDQSLKLAVTVWVGLQVSGASINDELKELASKPSATFHFWTKQARWAHLLYLLKSWKGGIRRTCKRIWSTFSPSSFPNWGIKVMSKSCRSFAPSGNAYWSFR